MVDDDAVAFVIERPCQHYHPAVAGMNRRTCGGVKVCSLMNARQLAVEHAPRAEAVCWLGRQRRVKTAVPKRLGGACGKDLALDLGFCLDLLEGFGAWLNKFGSHTQRAGTITCRMNRDNAAQVLCAGRIANRDRY